MIELKEFQKEASDQIAERFAAYAENPVRSGRMKTERVVPFFQELASITASGKTVILADSVQTIAAVLPVQPVVIWLSRGRVVVEQAFANLSAGGKYHHLLGDAEVEALAAYDVDVVRESSRPLVYFATVGTFNQKDKEEGGLRIYRSDIDLAEESTWEAIKLRLDANGVRRPLLIVYDEGHNLTDQQMDLLLELEPSALISASATSKVPARLQSEIKRLRTDAGWTDEDLVTRVDAKAVADSGLVKSRVELRGYQAPMEQTVDSLIADFRVVEGLAESHGVGAPKAVYVARTNIVEGNSLQKDDPKRPFAERQAPPILIWRYLVDQHGIDPDHIAVYASLTMQKAFPAPPKFHLFGGGDKDYAAFAAGDFRHIVFNLGLQEGWDDPLCYFAYIDKSMESAVQVEQVIGRLLRQPNTTHYPVEQLNTAHFYVRVDKRGVFTDLLSGVRQKLAADAPAIKLVETPPGKETPIPLAPKETRSVFATAQSSEQAVVAVEKLVESLHDYRNDDGRNTESKGARLLVQRTVGDEASNGDFEWEEFAHSNMVSARWLFQREVSRLFPGALRLAPTDDAKFDAKVGFDSKAHLAIKTLAMQVVDTHIDNIQLKQKAVDPYEVGPVMVRPSEQVSFKHALHDGYSDLGKEELDFALELDKTGQVWARNPSRSGYGIPLITKGRTRTFYPDFLIWRGDDVLAVDTTGPHLLGEKVARKLLAITAPKGETSRLIVLFVTKGKFTEQLEQIDKSGYSVWSLKPDRTLRAVAVDALEEAVAHVLGAEAP